MWCNRDSASHDAWYNWTMPPWPKWRLTKERHQGVYWVQGLHFQSRCSRSGLEMDIVKSSYATLQTLWDVILPYLISNPMGWALLSHLRMIRNIVQSEAAVSFLPPSAECSNVGIIMTSPFDIKGVASLNSGHFSVYINWGFRCSSAESRAFQDIVTASNCKLVLCSVI